METPNQRIGKVAFTEYGTWDKGQHFMLIQYLIPNQPRIQLAYIYLEIDEEKRATYFIKDKEGKELIPAVQNMSEVKKYFRQHGWELAQKILKQRSLGKRGKEQDPDGTINR